MARQYQGAACTEVRNQRTQTTALLRQAKGTTAGRQAKTGPIQGSQPGASKQATIRQVGGKVGAAARAAMNEKNGGILPPISQGTYYWGGVGGGASLVGYQL